MRLFHIFPIPEAVSELYVLPNTYISLGVQFLFGHMFFHLFEIEIFRTFFNFVG